jgi:hypothetical protein
MPRERRTLEARGTTSGTPIPIPSRVVAQSKSPVGALNASALDPNFSTLIKRISMILLPLPLLLLIHIHLLGYPQADEPEYDEHVFNVKVRGLRDRTKTMEDLCYFLVGKIEQKPPRMKSVSGATRPPYQKDPRAPYN